MSRRSSARLPRPSPNWTKKSLRGIEEARDDIRDGISEAPNEVLAALGQINVESIINEALEDAPRSVRMFVDEVDPAGLIDEIVENSGVESNEVGDATLSMVRSRLSEHLSSHVGELTGHASGQIASVRRQIAEGIAEMPPSVRQQLVDRNLPDIVDEAARNSHVIVRQFIEDVQIRETLNRALEGAEDGQRNSQRRQRLRRDRSSDERTRELEQRLERLLDEAAAIRRELRERDGGRN